MNSIYQPAEDSFLMSKNLKKIIPKLLNKNQNIKFLEIGSGSGINLQTAQEAGIKKENVFSVDINTDAVKHCTQLGFNCIKSNLFEKIQKKEFDLIIFNPPYLPEEKDYGKEPKDSELATTGGKRGNELSIKFLKQAKKFLKENGRILLITSSLAKQINFEKLGYKPKIIDEEKIFFEKLILWEITF